MMTPVRRGGISNPARYLPDPARSSILQRNRGPKKGRILLEKLIAVASRHGRADGLPSPYENLIIRSRDAPTSPEPALFESKFYLLLQGAKQMTVGGSTFDCYPGTSAVASVGLPFVSAVVEAKRTNPYLSVELKLDPAIVDDLLFDMRETADTGQEGVALTGALSVEQLEQGIVDPLQRLLGLLDAPADIPVLAAQYERELYYRLLKGPLGARLRQIGQRNARFGQIRMAADWIQNNANQPMSVEWLASHVGMSVTSFHRHFKSVTACSPLAYQRQIRLLDARRRLLSSDANVTETAYSSGYASPSQFSREYKRAFGTSPMRDAVPLQR
jgi:AraC-like DNA-binding protein